MQDWNDPSSTARVELVFESRNKRFGAYQLRRKYVIHLLSALVIAISFLIAIGIYGYIIININNKDSAITLKNEVISLTEPPPVDKSVPPPPPVEIPPPVQKTIKFTPPVVVRDEAAEDPPPAIEEMEKIQVGTDTHDGDTTELLPSENPLAPEPEEDKIFSYVEEMPAFPGGEKKMIEFILSNINYPPVARENNITGKVYVKFTVDKNGKIINPELLRGIGGGCDEEAVRILRIMPDWIPGRQNGNKVKVGGIVLHIDFTLK